MSNLMGDLIGDCFEEFDKKIEIMEQNRKIRIEHNGGEYEAELKLEHIGCNNWELSAKLYTGIPEMGADEISKERKCCNYTDGRNTFEKMSEKYPPK